MLVTDCGSYDSLKYQAQGAPIGHAIPSDAAEIAYWYLSVPKNAAHPNAAKLWINYWLGREGQDVLYELDFTDHYLVPGSKTAPAVEAQQAKGVKFAQIDVGFVQRNDEKELSRIREQLQSILQRKKYRARDDLAGELPMRAIESLLAASVLIAAACSAAPSKPAGHRRATRRPRPPAPRPRAS